jgi:hypothetical protein
MYRFPNETPDQCFARLQADIVAWIRADGHTDVLNTDCNNPQV